MKWIGRGIERDIALSSNVFCIQALVPLKTMFFGRVSEVRAGPTSPMPDHKGIKLQQPNC